MGDLTFVGLESLSSLATQHEIQPLAADPHDLDLNRLVVAVAVGLENFHPIADAQLLCTILWNDIRSFHDLPPANGVTFRIRNGGIVYEIIINAITDNEREELPGGFARKIKAFEQKDQQQAQGGSQDAEGGIKPQAISRKSCRRPRANEKEAKGQRFK